MTTGPPAGKDRSPAARSLTPSCRAHRVPVASTTERTLAGARRQSADRMTAHQTRDSLAGTSRPVPAMGRTLQYIANRADRPQVSPCRRTCRSNTDRTAHDAARRSNDRRLCKRRPMRWEAQRIDRKRRTSCDRGL